MPDKDQEIGGMNMVDELEDSLQELEKPISSMAKVSEPGRDTPRWAGSVRSRRLDFLASLCENKDYQDILVRLRELPVRSLLINTNMTLTLMGNGSIQLRSPPIL